LSATSPTENLYRSVRRVARRLWFGNVLLGISRAICLIAFLFWLTLGIDYVADRWFESGMIARGVLSCTWGALVLFISWRWIVQRVAARPADRSVALWMERHHPNLADQLITSIELRDPPDGTSASLVNESARRAWEIVGALDARRLISFRTVQSSGMIACLLIASIVLLACVAPTVVSVWSRRVMTLAMAEYPRQTRLSFKTAGEETTKIPKGKDFTIEVDVDPTSAVPDRAAISIQSPSNGGIVRESMTRQGVSHFRFVVRHPVCSMRFRVSAGDARSAWHRLELVESPLVTRATLAVRPPTYTELGEQSIPLSGSAVSLPAGSDLTVSLAFSKELKSLTISDDQTSIPSKKLGDTEHQFQTKLDRSRKYRVQVVDRDGLSLAEEFLIELLATPDRPPEITASIRGVSPGITRLARIPLHVKGDDDYGIERMEYAVSISESPPTPEPMNVVPSRVTSFEQDVSFDVGTLHLEPGTHWTLQIVGMDHLGQTGTSEKFGFEIITPEELVTRMAAQEVTLRERFEQVVSELREAQRALSEIGDDSVMDGPARRLACNRAMAIVRKGSGETKSIAEGFANIIEEFTNNQMASADILERLGNGIRLPMNRLCEEAFPRTIADLEKLSTASETKEYLPARDASLVSLNEALIQCEQILRGMSKLESFNELVSNLKGIIDEEQKLRDNIQKARKEKALDLLKD